MFTKPKTYDISLEIQQTFIQKEASATMLTAVATSVINDVRIVACEHKEVERFHFSQLLNVFDINIWLALIVAIFTSILVYCQNYQW